MKLIKEWIENDTVFRIYEIEGKYNLYSNGYFECRKDSIKECEDVAYFIETISFPIERLC